MGSRGSYEFLSKLWIYGSKLTDFETSFVKKIVKRPNHLIDFDPFSIQLAVLCQSIQPPIVMWYYLVLDELDRFFHTSNSESLFHNDSKRVREKVFQNEPMVNDCPPKLGFKYIAILKNRFYAMAWLWQKCWHCFLNVEINCRDWIKEQDWSVILSSTQHDLRNLE